MNDGRILVSREGDTYLLKLSGDLRVTLCGSIAQCMRTIFSDDKVDRVVIDLLAATGLDSTTLGLLAKLGLHCRDKFGVKAEVFCQEEGILRTFECMGLEELFDIYEDVPDEHGEFAEVAGVLPESEEVRQHVLEAHKILVDLNPDMRNEFVDLIRALETEGA